MRLLYKILTLVWVAAALLGLDPGTTVALDTVDKRLAQLAERATKKGSWRHIRRFAYSARDPEQRGLAFFLLGYRQFAAKDYRDAASTFREAVQTQFSLRDFAEYFLASTREKSGRPEEAIQILEGFATRHMQSPFRFRAVELLAQAYLETDHPDSVLALLGGEGRAPENPALALLFARAHWKAGNFEKAAKAFQEIYYFFPSAPESGPASDALVQLRSKLGQGFPPVAEEVEAGRAESLYAKGRFERALAEYEALLRGHPANPLSGRWGLARARCLLRLRRADEAVEVLEALVSTSLDVDAERLALLVDIFARQGDRDGMLRELARLQELYPDSSANASAMASAANYFARRGDWDTAAHYDRMIATDFPKTEAGREANWRVAWHDYLFGEPDQTRQAFVDHLTRYPDSPHAPAGFYWLGKLAEARGQTGDARSLYEFLTRRYAHSYYGALARRRLPVLPVGDPVTRPSGEPSMEVDSGVLVQMVPQLYPPGVPPCGAAQHDEVVHAFSVLRELALDDLAEDILNAALAERPNSPELLMALSRFKAEDDANSGIAAAKRLVPNYVDYEFDELPQELWELLFPRTYTKLIEREARKNHLDPGLVMGLIRQESGFNPQATSWANARGLMQILPQTASPGSRRRRLAARRLYDPAYNVRLGSLYLRHLVQAYRGNLEEALAAYHAGTPNVEIWRARRRFDEPGEFLEIIPIRDTRLYVEAVLRDADIYRQLSAGGLKFKLCSPITTGDSSPSAHAEVPSILTRSNLERAGERKANSSRN